MLVLTDVDGVLRDPCKFVKIYLSGPVKNWNGYFKRTPEMPAIPGMIEVINGLMLWGCHDVYFGTGCSESNRSLTTQWLNTHLQSWVRNERLLMRPNKDRSHGSALKLAWALQLHPDLIFDDEPETVEVLRDKGFTVCRFMGTEFQRTTFMIIYRTKEDCNDLQFC